MCAFFGLLVSGWQTAQAARIIYVAADAPGGGNGTSWGSAYNSLPTAISQSSPSAANPVEIWIKTGVYRPILAVGSTATVNERLAVFALKSQMTLRGGFTGSESSPDQRPAASSATRFTVLSGDIGARQPDTVTETTTVNDAPSLAFDPQSSGAADNSYNLLLADGLSAVVLDRLVVAGGRTDDAGIPTTQVETMLYPSLDANPGFVEEASRYSNGGGLFAKDSSIAISDCWFVGNLAKGLGGGLATRGGQLDLVNCRFVRNVAGYAGGGVCIQETAINNVSANTFYGNGSSFMGGGMLLEAAPRTAYLKGYLTNVMIGVSALSADDTGLSLPGAADPKTAYSYMKTVKAGAVVAQALTSAYVTPKIIQKFGSEALKSLARSATPFTLVYGVASMTVNIVDLGFSIAQLAGLDPNNQHLKNWTLFSTNFATYATPMGLAQTLYNLLDSLLIPSPSFEKRATNLRNQDFKSNQNPAAAIRLSGNRFEKNYSGSIGGGLAVVHANVVVSQSRFIANTSVFGGAAATFLGYNNADLENSVLTGNVASSGSSAVTLGFRTVNRFINDTFSNNHSNTAQGYAIGADAGADLSLANSILWGNTNGNLNDAANPNRFGGADVFATRYADLDDGAKKGYDEAGDSHGMSTAVADIQFCDIESLNRLALGQEKFDDIPGYLLSSYRDSGTLVANGTPNVGEGIASINGRSNIATDPILIQGIYPYPYSAALNAGSDKVLFRNPDFRDVDFNNRRIGRIDMGASESNGTIPSGTILYVNGAVASSGNGLTWASAFKTLPEALAVPISAGSQIWVAGGTYKVTTGTNATATMVLAPGVSLIGGFAPGATSLSNSDPVLRPTIVSGEIGSASSNVDNTSVLLDGTTTLENTYANLNLRAFPRIIRGFRFTAANATSAAVRLSVPAVIQSCTFDRIIGSRALSFDDSGHYNDTASAQIFDSIFQLNTGGAVTCTSTNLEVIRSQFYDNSDVFAGAIYKNRGHATDSLLLERNIFYRNSATSGRGGAVYYEGSDLVAAQNVFNANTAQPSANDVELTGGGGLYWQDITGSTRVTRYQIINNIFYGNRILGNLAASTPLELQQCSLPTEFSSKFTPTLAGNSIEGLSNLAVRGGSDGNVDFDPFFVDSAGHNFSLSSDSFLQNRGVDYSSSNDSGTTIYGLRDIGAVESTNTAIRNLGTLTLTSNKPSETGRSFTLTASGFNPGASAFVWEVMRPNTSTFVTVANDSYHAGASGPTLNITNLPHTWSGSIYRLRYNDSGRSFTNDVTLQTPPAILYVDSAKNGDGTTWAKAFGNLSSALAIAQPYTQIWLRQGTHIGTAGGIPAGVRIYGGFSGTETVLTQRSPLSPASVLTFPSGGYLLLNATATWAPDSSAVPTVFDSVTFTAPAAAPYALWLWNGDFRVNNCKFTGLPASAIYVYKSSGEITASEFSANGSTPLVLTGASLHISSSIFARNRHNSEGGTIRSYSSALTVTDSRFSENTGASGGAIFSTGGGLIGSTNSGSLDVQRSRFFDNSASRGGAVAVGSGVSSRIANSLFARNSTSNSGGAINDASGALNLIHDTFVDNRAGFAGGAINTSQTATLTNSIAWGNSAASGGTLSGSFTIVNSHVQNQGAAIYAPLFDLASPDYTLSASSPLIDHGGSDDAISGLKDLSGAVRRYAGAAADLGASEFQGAPGTPVYFTIPPANQSIYAGRPVTFTLAGHIGSLTGSSSFGWEYFDGTSWKPISSYPGWTLAATAEGSTLTFESVTQAMDGLQLRVSAPGSQILSTVTLTVKPRVVLRVDGRVASSGDGSTWVAAYKSISAALAAANGDTDLWIAGGDYPETSLTSPSETRLYVGFAGGEAASAGRDPIAHPVRLAGASSFVALSPGADFTLPEFAFRIVASPAPVTCYVQRPISFTARNDGSGAALAWQYLSGSAWLPVSGLSGWTVSQAGEVSTLSCPSATQAQNGLQIRAITPGSNEASFPATLTVRPRSILYVKSTVTASGNGRSWATAFKTIAEALAVADDGTDIWIAGGTYNDRTLASVPGSNLYAGFVGNETSLSARDIALHPVRLQGPGSTFDFTAGTNNFRYVISSPPRSRALYINQPGSVSISLASAGSSIQWQYSANSGATWLPISNRPDWVVNTTGLTSRIVNAAVPLTDNALMVRVVVPSSGEISTPVTLSVRVRSTFYVNAAATAGGDGRTWNGAFRTLNAALAAADDGSDVWIAQGTYNEGSHTVGTGTHLYGGFSGSETDLAARNPVTHPVILRNPAGSRIFDIDLSDAEFDLLTLVDSVTLTDGAATDAAVRLKGRSIAFQAVNFSQSSRAVLAEGADTLASFDSCAFTGNPQGIVSETGSTVAVTACTFSQNGQALTSNGGASVSVTSTGFDHNTDYAISAASGASLGDSTFSANAHDIVITGSGSATTTISSSTFTSATVSSIVSATAVSLSDCGFSGGPLALDFSGAANGSTFARCNFAGIIDAVHAPAGITVTDSTFAGNVRGLSLTANGTAISHINTSSFLNHTETGLLSSGALMVTGATFTGNLTGLSQSASAEVSSISGSTFEGNTIGVSSTAGLSVTGSSFHADRIGIAFAGGSLGSTVQDTTFTDVIDTGIASATRLATGNVTFGHCATGITLTGGSGISRIVGTTFTRGGAGMAVSAPACAEIVDSTFTGLSDTGLAVSGINLPAVNNVITYNVVVTHGSFTGNTGVAFASGAGSYRLDRCTFTGNVTPGSLVVANGSSSADYLTLSNSLIAQNTATSGGATVRVSGAHLTMTSSTVADNETGDVAGAVSGGGLSGDIRQTIFWGNRASATLANVELMQWDHSSSYVPNRGIIEGLQASNYTWMAIADRNSVSDPIFTNAAAGDYTLQPYSPAIDAGGLLSFSGLPNDLAGAPRVQFASIDMGAYESTVARAANPLQLIFSSAPQAIVIGDSATFTAAFTTGGGRAIRWQVNTGSGWADLVPDASQSVSYVNGVLRLVIGGDPALSGRRYRAVISENGTDIYSSPDSVFSVVARPIYYVDASAAGSATGANWANAFTSLSAALNVAPAFSDIRVAEGTYRAPANSSFQLRRRQRILGSFIPGGGTRDSLNHATVLSCATGAANTSIILATNADQGVVDNLTAVDGLTFRSGGIGMALLLASPVVRDCHFENLVSGIVIASGQLQVKDSTFTGNTGSAIRGGYADLSVDGCVFQNNAGGPDRGSETAGAGAIALGYPMPATPSASAQTAVITNSIFTRNTGLNGGAVSSYKSGSNLSFYGCQFTGNVTTGGGGAIYGNSDNTVTVRQSLFTGNQAVYGAAISSPNVSLFFSTVADNQVSRAYESAIDVSGNLTIRDSIVWGNTAVGATTSEEYTQIRIASTSSDLSDTIIQDLKTRPGTRLLPFDPLFLDAAGGNFRLSASSPAIGIARPADLLAGESDLTGISRPAGAGADLGAYETAAAPAPVYSLSLPSSISTNIGGNFDLTQIAPIGFTSSWEYLDGATWKIINLLGQPSTGPAGATSFVNTSSTLGNSTLNFREIGSSLNGLKIRFRLNYQGTDYYTNVATVVIAGFETIFVDASITTSGDGRSWNGAFKTLGEGVAAISSSRRIIQVAEGTYRGPFLLPMRFEIYGGFPAGGSSFADRNPSAHPTVLTGLPAVSGDARASAVVRLVYSGENYTQPVFEGFTLENGQTGLLADPKVFPVLRNLIVRGHTNSGMLLQGANGSVEDSLIENNTGINGGGISAAGLITLDRVILRGNSATNGGGAWINGGTLRNVVVTGNVATTGGGLWLNSGPTLLQTTIASNRAANGPAAYVNFGAPTLSNSIVWGNRNAADSGSSQLTANGLNVGVLYNLNHTIVEQSSPSSAAILFDPIFTAPVLAVTAPSAAGDYTLRSVSPAIDAGDDTLAAGLTFDATRRPRFTGTVDLGAYESATAATSPLTITTQPAALVFDRDRPVNRFTVGVHNSVSILWQYAAPGGAWISLDGVAGFSGATTATLTLTNANTDLNGYRFRALITAADGSVIATEERTLTIYAPRLYVNGNRSGTDVGDGQSWATAYRSLDTALASIPLNPPTAEVWIAAGSYTPATAFNVRAGVSLYGGFAGNETNREQRDPIANVTTLNGTTGQPAIVKIATTPALDVPARLDSMTIRDTAGRGIDDESAGRALTLEHMRFTGIKGGAVYSSNAALIIRTSEFSDNGSDSDQNSTVMVSRGSALIEGSVFSGNNARNYPNSAYLSNAAVTIRDCDFLNNGFASGSNRQALNIYASNPTITGTRFYGNRSNDSSSALSVSTSSATLRFCEFRGNYGPSTMDMEGGAVENVLFAGNVATNGFPAGSFSQPVDLRNVTIANNYGGSPTLFVSANTRLYNCIYWGNRVPNGDIVDLVYATNMNTVSHCVSDRLARFQAPFNNRIANVSIDPKFVDPIPASSAPTIAGDYHMSGTSGAVDLGDNAAYGSFNTDLAGNPRVHGLYVDPGAYEYQRDDVYAITTQPADAMVDAGVVSMTVAGSRPATYTWEESSDGGLTFTPLAGTNSSTLNLPASAAIDGHLFRVRMQFVTGPLVVSNAAKASSLTLSASADLPGGYSTPRTFTGTANIAPASWQWQVSTDGAIFSDVPGGTARSLAVLGDASFSSRSYRVRATYVQGSVLTSNAVPFLYADSVTAPGSSTSGIASALAFNLPGGVQPASLSGASLSVHASLSGRLTLADFSTPVFSASGVALAFDPAAHAGEKIQVSATAALRRADGVGVRPRVWEFRTPVNSGVGLFDTATAVGASGATAQALGDLDGNSSVDALVATPTGIQLYSNNGAASFLPVRSPFGPLNAKAIVAGSLTPTGALDAAVLTSEGDVQIWRNNGSGSFTLAQSLPGLQASALAFGDLDADGDLDFIVATAAGTRVWLNDGMGIFSAGAALDGAVDRAVAIGDFDADGDLDIVVTGASGTSIWLNDASGGFTAGNSSPSGFDRVAVADLDSDGQFDIVLVAAGSAASLWHNLGNARFETLGSLPGGGNITTLATGDTDGDGRTDLVLTDSSGQTGAWLTSPALDNRRAAGQPDLAFGAVLDLADLDGDGTLDLFGLDSSGTPAVSLYRVAPSRGEEDTTLALAITGFRPTAANVYIRTLPTRGILLSGANPVTVGTSFTLAQAGNLTYRPEPDFNGLDSFDWSATASGAVHPHWLYVNPVPDNVAAVADAIALVQGGTARILTNGAASVLANDGNHDAGTLEATLLGGPLHGTLTLNRDGTFRYVHDDSTAFIDSFTYQAANLSSGSFDSVTVSIAITRHNVAPDSLTLTPGTVTPYTGQLAGYAVGTLSATDADPEDAGQLTYALVSGTGSDNNADFLLDGSVLKTAVVINASGGLTRSIRVRVSDSIGASLERTFAITFIQTPLAASGSFATDEDTPVEIPLAGSGGDITLGFQIVTPPSHGTLTPSATSLAANLFTYTPAANFHGADTFIYRVIDSSLSSANATVTLSVASIDDAPTLAAIAPIGIDEDTSASFTLLGSDGDGDPLIYQLVGAPALGVVHLNGPAVTYKPDANASGIETLSFTASDGTYTSAPLQVVITIAPVNDAPVIEAIPVRTVYRNGKDTFTPVASDVESSSLTLRVGTAAVHGAVMVSGGSVTYIPAPGYTGADSYTLIVSDGSLDSAPISVAVNVVDLDTEAMTLVVYRGLSEYSDVPAAPSGDWSGVQPADLSQPAHGSVTWENGHLLYSHNGDAANADGFTYKLTNANNDIRTVAVTIAIKEHVILATSVADSGPGTIREALGTVARFANTPLAPDHTATADWTIGVRVGDSQYLRTTAYTTDSPADGFSSAFKIQGKVTIDATESHDFFITIQQGSKYARHFSIPAGSSLTLKNLMLLNGRADSDGMNTSRGGQVFNSGAFTAQSVIFKFGQANNGASIYNNGGTVSLNNCSFIDNIVQPWPDAVGGVVLSRNGGLSLSGVSFSNGADPELYVYGDGALATVDVWASTVGPFQLTTLNGGTLAVTGLPKAFDDGFSHPLGLPLNLTIDALLANDAGGPFASVTVDSTSSQGVVITREGDDLHYSAPTGVHGEDSFNYTVTTASGATSTAKVSVRIAADPLPHGMPDNAVIYRGLHEEIDVLANDSSETGEPLAISAIGAPQHGTAVLEGNLIRYSHDGGAEDSDTFTYSVSTPTHTTASVTVTLAIRDRVADATDSADSGDGTLRSALNLVNRFAGETLAPAHTAAPDWTVRIMTSADQNWQTTSNSSNNGNPYDLSAFSISGIVTIDAGLSPNFELGSEQPHFDTVRNFLVQPGASLTLKNLTLAGRGYSFGFTYFEGGSILNYGNFTADHVSFTGHSANMGGAVFNNGGTGTLTGCDFSNNSAPYWTGLSAGIVASSNGSLTLDGVTFQDQYANPELFVVGDGALATIKVSNSIVGPYRLDRINGGALSVTGLLYAGDDVVTKSAGTFQIPVTDLFANDSSSDQGSLVLAAVDSYTANGVPITRDGDLLTLIPDDPSGMDAFSYTVSDSTGGTWTATVSLLPGSQILVISPDDEHLQPGASLDFGTVTPGDSKEIVITIRNDGGSDLTPLDFSLEGDRAHDFIISPLSATTLAPGASTTLTITMAPSSSGSPNGLLHIVSNDPDHPLFDLTLTGMSNTPPVFTGYSVSTAYENATEISLIKLLAKASDADGDVLTVTAAENSAAGASVWLQSGSIFYSPPAGFSGSDSLPITITDSRGASVGAEITMTVQPSANAGGMGVNPPKLTMMSGGKASLFFHGIPGRTYLIQRSTDVTNWTTMETLTAGPTGALEYIDEHPPQPSGFYRVKAP